ncbi:MAG: ATP-dependent Clp protease adaptor ClpS [Bacteroidales bacterium]|nr:ATP-dependent Clp protease adaptor ClpS [Bacteroidales bacterium]
MNSDTKNKTEEKKKNKTISEFEAQLIVFNDDHNTFEHVIRCFIEICKITFDKASQFALNIHVRGQETVKTGEFEEMRTMKDQLVDCGLSAVVQRGELN